LEKGLAALLADHFPDKRPQGANVVPQGGILVGKSDLAMKRDAHGGES